MPLSGPNAATDAAIAKAKGEVTSLFDLVKKAGSFRLWFTCWGVWKFGSLGLSTMEADAIFAWRMFALSFGCIACFILSETVVKFSSLRVLEKRAISVDLTDTIGKVGS
jgi:hypothetical protein